MAWSRTRPKAAGEYHVADREGNYAGVRTVMPMAIQRHIDASGARHDGSWRGWWFDVAIEMPPEPPRWDPKLDAWAAEHGHPDTFDKRGHLRERD